MVGEEKARFKWFYSSTAWKKCREAYKKKVSGLCERCLAQGMIRPAEVVHHKIYLTDENIKDPKVSLSFDNLEALCWEHHEQEHKGRMKRYSVDETGKVRSRL